VYGEKLTETNKHLTARLIFRNIIAMKKKPRRALFCIILTKFLVKIGRKQTELEENG
jgi:hypothetical protein